MMATALAGSPEAGPTVWSIRLVSRILGWDIFTALVLARFWRAAPHHLAALPEA